MKSKEKIKDSKKIKDVKINERQHFFLFFTMLIVFNIIMISASITLLVMLKEWYLWLLVTVVLAVVLWVSYRTYRDRQSFHRCELHERYLVVNSIWFDTLVDLSQVFDVKVKKSWLDKLCKINTLSLEIYMKSSTRSKFTLHFVEEDAEALKDEIMKLAIECRKK